jgi:uncharacterized protein (DUF427 family)
MKIPGPDHPITITPAGDRVTIHFGGHVVADTRRALLLQEASYPPVLYVPREDADMPVFHRSDTATHCPYKGDAGYFSLRVGDAVSEDAVWSYEAPFDAVSAIAGHLAFYPDRVESIERRPA